MNKEGNLIVCDKEENDKKKFIGIILCGILVVVKISTFEIHQKKIFSIKFILSDQIVRQIWNKKDIWNPERKQW